MGSQPSVYFPVRCPNRTDAPWYRHRGSSMALGETNKSAVSSYIPRTERLGCVQDDGVYLKTGTAELDLAAG
jgi:hypothetical protein